MPGASLRDTGDTLDALSRTSLQRHHRLLREIVSQAGEDPEVQMRHALARATDLLGLDQGLLARVDGARQVVEHYHGADGRFETGQVIDRDEDDGARALAEDGLVALDHVTDGADGGPQRPCYDVLALASYIGTPVYAGDRLYGALAFGGAAPRRRPFTKTDRSLVRLLGDWTGALLERRRADAARRETQARLRLLAENVSDMVCLHDLGGACMYVSPSSERLLGHAPEEMQGVSTFEFVHPDDHDRIRDAAGRALRGEPDVVARSRLRHADGSYRWCETAGHPVYADDGETVMHFLTSTRDIAGRVEAEEELQRTNDELRLRNRELKDFAHIASHDLQEPLRKVRAFADLMREDYAEEVGADGQYYLERMQDGAARMSRLVSDLLSLSRVTTGGHPFESVDLNEIADVVRTDLEMRIEETGGQVLVGALPGLDADPTQMRQLLQNLISNALKFHRDGVAPVVEVRGTRGPAGEQSDAPAGHAVDLTAGVAEVCRLVVEDNGIGFENKYADRIFTPLQRLHGRGEYEGTGVGLSVCRRIVERHGGALWAESQAGAGSRFIALLPATHPADGPDDAEKASIEKSSSEELDAVS